MVDLPRLDHLWDGQKDCPGDRKNIWSLREIPGNMPLHMPLGPLCQSCFLESLIGAFVGLL